VLRRPDKPGNVSVLGERRFGKSSFLNQIYGALAAELDLVSIRATTQDWSDACLERFFTGLHRAILDALDGTEHIGQATGARSVTTRLCGISSGGLLGRACALCCCWTSWGASPVVRHSTRISSATCAPWASGPSIASAISSPAAGPSRSYAGTTGSRSLLSGTSSASPTTWVCWRNRRARDLATEPLERSLTADQRPDDLDRIWTQETAPLTGRHPNLIQLVLAHRWNAWSGGFNHNQDRIQLGLREYLEDLWRISGGSLEDLWFNRHGEKEWEVLIRVVNGAPPTLDPILQDLRLRGLVTSDNRPFSPRFGQLIPSLMPEGMSLAEVAEQLRKGGDTAVSLLEKLEKFARLSGRLVRSFQGKDPDAEPEEDND